MFGLITKAKHEAEMASLRRMNRALDRVAVKFRDDRDNARTALHDIAEMETPGSAHIGKRMAARARQALGLETTRQALGLE